MSLDNWDRITSVDKEENGLGIVLTINLMKTCGAEVYTTSINENIIVYQSSEMSLDKLS